MSAQAREAFPVEHLLSQAEGQRERFGHRSFFGYGYALLQKARLYVLWNQILTYIRRFRMVSLVLKVISFLFALLQTGTLVLLGTLLFLIVLPILTSLLLGLLITAVLESRRTDHHLRERIVNRRVLVCFAPTSQTAFFRQNVYDFAARDWVVLAISAHWVSPRGFEKKRFYCTAREEIEGVYFVRPYYFFHLRRKVLKKEQAAYWY